MSDTCEHVFYGDPKCSKCGRYASDQCAILRGQMEVHRDRARDLAMLGFTCLGAIAILLAVMAAKGTVSLPWWTGISLPVTFLVGATAMRWLVARRRRVHSTA